MLPPNAFSLPKAIRAPRSRFPLKNSQRYFHVFILCFPLHTNNKRSQLFFTFFHFIPKESKAFLCGFEMYNVCCAALCVCVYKVEKQCSEKRNIDFSAYKILWIKLPRESTVQLLISISAPKSRRPGRWHRAPAPQFVTTPTAASIFRQQSAASSSTYLVNVQIHRRHYSTPRTIFR